MNSIRQRLLAFLLAALLAASAAGGVFTYRKAQEEVDALFDYQLRQMAQSLRYQSFLGAQAIDDPDTDFVTQVWDASGVLMYLSRPRLSLPRLQAEGFQTVAAEDGRWRVYTLADRAQVIQVAQPMSLRTRMAGEIALRIAAPFLAAVPLLGLFIWIVVGRGMAPLTAIARSLVARNAASLSPLPDRNLPAEVRPLVSALNDLFTRLERALKLQREFLGDAAHALRTPLTAVQLQLQLLERAKDDAERAEALARLQKGVERSVHLVQQLLSVARLEPQALERRFAPVRIEPLLQEIVAEHAALAQDRGVDLGVNRSEPLVVQGDEASLRELVGNLVDNAIRYTPPGGTVNVNVRADPQCAAIEVEDTGPGIPPAERERVFDRFYRRPQAGEPGSGLGLSIVRRIAELHGASVSLEDGAHGRGLKATVRLPLPGGHMPGA